MRRDPTTEKTSDGIVQTFCMVQRYHGLMQFSSHITPMKLFRMPLATSASCHRLPSSTHCRRPVPSAATAYNFCIAAISED